MLAAKELADLGLARRDGVVGLDPLPAYHLPLAAADEPADPGEERRVEFLDHAIGGKLALGEGVTGIPLEHLDVAAEGGENHLPPVVRRPHPGQVDMGLGNDVDDDPSAGRDEVGEIRRLSELGPLEGEIAATV